MSVSRSKTRRGLLAVALWLCALIAAGSSPARAESADENEASCLRDRECAEHYENARRLSKAGQTEAALAQYQVAYQRRPAPRLLYSIARLQHKLGQTREAQASYQRFLETSVAADEDLRSKAREYSAQLQQEAAQGAQTSQAPGTGSSLTATAPAADAQPDKARPIYKKGSSANTRRGDGEKCLYSGGRAASGCGLRAHDKRARWRGTPTATARVGSKVPGSDGLPHKILCGNYS
jgi:tetratricopeptide (TPR) repeat protein